TFEHGEVLRSGDDEALEGTQVVVGAAARRVHVDEVVNERLGVRTGERVVVLGGDPERLLQRGRPLPGHHLRVLVPALEHLHQVLVVVLGAEPVVVLVGDAGLAVLLRDGDVALRDHFPVPVVLGDLGAGGGLEHHLGLAVTVEVVDQELGVVGSGPDVHAQVDAVEQGAVQLVRVDVDVAGVALLGDVLGVGGVPLDDVLVLPVPVHVTDAHVVGGVGVRLPHRGDAVGRALQRQVVGVAGPGRDRGAEVDLHTVHHRGDLGRGVPRPVLVEVVGAVGDGRDQGAVPVDVEVRAGQSTGGVAGDLVREQPPAEEYPVVGGGRDQAAVEVLQLDSGQPAGTARVVPRRGGAGRAGSGEDQPDRAGAGDPRPPGEGAGSAVGSAGYFGMASVGMAHVRALPRARGAVAQRRPAGRRAPHRNETF